MGGENTNDNQAEDCLCEREEKYLEDAYRLANEGWLRWIILHSLVVLCLKLRIVRLVERIHVKLKRVASVPGITWRILHTDGLHLRNYTLCRIQIVQTIILTRNEIVGIIRVVFVIVRHSW